MQEDNNIRELKKKHELIIKNLEERHEIELKSKDEQIEIFKNEIKFLREMVKQNANKPIKIVNENKFLPEIGTVNKNTDQSHKMNITGGTIYNSGAGAFSLGDISGTVANTINQLATSSDSNQPRIKELLEKLLKAIEMETELNDLDKSDALEEVQILAEASQSKDQKAKTTIVAKSVRHLGRIANDLPDNSTLGNVSKEVLPAIAELFESCS